MGSDKKKDREKELMFQDIEGNDQSHSDSEHLAREKGLKRGRDDDHSQLKTPPQKQRRKKLRGKVAGDPKTHKSTPKSGVTKTSAKASSSVRPRRTRGSLFNTEEEPGVTKASAEASYSVRPRRTRRCLFNSLEESTVSKASAQTTYSVTPRRTRRSLSNAKEGSSVPSKRRKSTRSPVASKVNAMVIHGQNSTDALVLHKEQKALVQKSHQTKVNLDDETKRVWKLMQKNMDYDDTELDEERKIWWEQERRVIYERAHSFINRMRLVQGDRTFSSWRGSVVDSVVGVFLTQNVADHLSSSAFMDIAAEVPSEHNSSKGSMIDEAATPTCIVDEVDDDEDGKKILATIGGDQIKKRSERTMDIVDWDALRCTSVEKIAHLIRKRGMNKMLSERIKGFLNKVYNEGDEIDLEWLRDARPDEAKEYLSSIHGLGLKSVECVRLLSLHQIAFPVDTNVGRIVVRLGWVPLEPLPGDLQMHLLDQYPVLNSVQKYLWPRLCKLDHKTLYELHYHLITFGKVFCTKQKPNCEACPMKAECAHYASARGRAHHALPETAYGEEEAVMIHERRSKPNLLMVNLRPEQGNDEPIIEEPASPEPELADIEDCPDPWGNEDIIPLFVLNKEAIGTSQMLVPRSKPPSFPTRKQKVIERLRTEHYVYELPDNHILLRGFDKREPEDKAYHAYYLLAIWKPVERDSSIQRSKKGVKGVGENSKTVRGTILIPCRTAMKGGFPLNGTYFQTNEVFADHFSSKNPIYIRKDSIKNLRRCVLFCGSSVTACFKELSLDPIRESFWSGYVCVRGFDRKSGKSEALVKKLHCRASQKKKDDYEW